MLLAQFALALTLAQGPQDATKTGVAGSPAPSSDQVSVLYLANEGFLIRSGGVSVLIDAFVGEAPGGFDTLPRKASRLLASGSAPFDGVVLSLVSHAHPDHLQVRLAERFLNANKTAEIVSSPNVFRMVANRAENFDSIKSQIRVIDMQREGTTKRFNVANSGATVDFMLLPHGGEGNEGSANYGHLITMGTHRLLHLGDVAADKQIFSAYDFAAQQIDIAFVPYWFFLSQEGIDIVDKSIAASYTIVCHVPVKERAKFYAQMAEMNPHVLHFEESMESKVFTEGPPRK